MRKLFARLFLWSNVLPLLIVATAFIVTLQPTIFGMAINQNNVVLALLGFLALDSLVARLGHLQDIKESLRKVESVVVSGDVPVAKVLHTGKSRPRMDELINDASQEIFIVGINLEGTTRLIDSLKDKVSRGCRLRLLALDPQGASLESFCRMSNIRTEIRRSKIQNNLELLALSFADVRGDWELHVVDAVFPAGCAGIDMKHERGKLVAQHYMYHTRTENAPVLILTHKSDPFWFEVYREQMESLWRDSTAYHAVSQLVSAAGSSELANLDQ